jgi:hypothetical protein
MDLTEALDRHTIISVNEAMAEIENHGHECYILNDVLWASSEPGQFEQVCIVVRSEVHSRQIMRWLGY